MPKKEKKLPKGSEAVASFCALVLRRLQDEVGVSGVLATDDTAVTVSDLNAIFGEALQQFSVKAEVPEDE